ncbi:MAG: polyhydroxyalkanoic acid system family protein, partial [Planctomycetales bacterium]|nr:polyhydroxyalkanoic acid system family protein [Planctomycetales bacterium]
MPKFSLDVPHELGAAEARERLERFAELLHSQYKDQVADLSQTWQGNSLAFGFKTLGIKVSGAIDVAEDCLSVNGDLPFAAMMFKGK